MCEVAAWCDEEYRLACMVPVDKPEGYDAQTLMGYRHALADLAGLLRSWAASGKPPPHRKVRDEWRIPFERMVREEALAALKEVGGG